MLNASFLKFAARQKLGGDYFKTVLGAVVMFVPSYLITMLSTVMMYKSTAMGALSVVVVAILNIIITDVFSVGYMRSLLLMKEPGEENRYDINTVLSGFTKNYKNTVKIVFLKKLYLFGWEFLFVMPIVLLGGITAFISDRPEIAKMIELVKQVVVSPTQVMVENLATHIAENCMYFVVLSVIAAVVSVLLLIPYVRKSYEYEMISIIVAENPNLSAKDAFGATSEVMCGYRITYFLIQLSFLGVYIIASLVASLLATPLLLYAVFSLVIPYINMTFIQFYLERRSMINESKTEIINEGNEAK